MKKTLVYLLASLVVVMMSAQVYAKIEWSGHIMTGIEKMDFETEIDGMKVELLSEDGENQFSNTKLNLDVKADVCDGVSGVVELRGEWEDIWTRQVYVEMIDILIPDASIRIGRIELPLGAEAAKVSEGANTMRNPLIFNSLIGDLIEEGYLDYGLVISKTLGAVNCKLGISNGTGEAADTNSDKAITVNLSGDCPAVPGLSLAGTYYVNDNETEEYEDLQGNDVGQDTEEITGWLVDVAFVTGLWKLAASYGNIEVEENYYEEKEEEVDQTIDIDARMLEIVYGNGETPWWVAVRHSQIDGNIDFVDPLIDNDDIKITKLQLGAGYKICPTAYLKVEYVKDKEELKEVEGTLTAKSDGIKAIVNVAF